MSNLHPIVETLRDARHETHISQREVARRMGTVQSAISEMESGAVVPSLGTASRYAEALGFALILVPAVDS